MNYMTELAAAANPELAADIGGARIPTGAGYHLRWASDEQRRQSQDLVIMALRQLADPCRDVVGARYGTGLTLAGYGRQINRSRERIRQLQSKALRHLRHLLRSNLAMLRDAVGVVPVPGGPHDPAWMTTWAAHELTTLSLDHLRYLCRTGRVVVQERTWKRQPYRISRASLKQYILGVASDGRSHGIWKGDQP